jgi:hypothetical protein
MKVKLHSTKMMVDLMVNGVPVPARIWEGHTESGTPVHAFITRICPTIEQPLPARIEAEFARELQEQAPPTPMVATIPLRMIL